MASNSWKRILNSLFGAHNQSRNSKRRLQARFSKLHLEALEDRVVPANNLTTLASFNGLTPTGGLVADSGGNLYGAATNGTIFEIAKGSNSITNLATVTGTPNGGLVVDSQGDVFGTTQNGTGHTNGSVFEIVQGSGTATTLASFTGTTGTTPGATPMSGLAMDANGNLFGTTNAGGTLNQGTVFKLTLNNGSYTFSSLASFTSGGVHPQGSLVLDSNDDVFGTTTAGGSASSGTVFEVAHGTNVLSTLASFGTNLGTGNSNTGTTPKAGLVADSNGNLYGTSTAQGANQTGTVFELANTGTASSPSYGNKITPLASFGSGITSPSGLVVDPDGNLFGTTSNGGANNDGMVFAVLNGSGAITPFVSFANDANGGAPLGGVIAVNNALFGTTSNHGANGTGTVFTVTGSSQPTLSVTGGGTYNTNPIPASATAVVPGTSTPVSGSFTYNYYVGSDTTGTNLGSTAPTNAGTYTVVATFTSNDINYASGGTAQNTFTINPAQLTVTAVALNKPSDGTTTGYAILSDTPLGTDQVTAVYTTATFANAGPGNGITVTVSGISLIGPAANNYTPANTTATSTANIVNTTNPVTTLDSQKRLIGIVYTTGNVYERTYASDGTSAATLSNPTTGTIRSGVILDAYGYNAAGGYTSITTYYTSGNVFNRTYHYDTNGNLTDSFATLTNPITNTVIPNVASQDWTYNAAGQVTIQHNFYTNGNVYTRTYQFDGNGNVTGSTATLFDSSNTKLADYTYGVAGNLTDYKAYSANGNVYEITYNADGTSKATLTNSGGPVSPNVTSQDWFYNAAGKVTSQDNFYTNGNVYTRTYQFDNNGNTTGSTATLTNSGGPVSPGVTKDTYNYNVAGQILSVVANYTNGNTFTRTFNYDNNGNLTGSTATTVSGGATQTTLLSYTYDAQNRITSLTVGANGNVLNYSYDSNGVLTGATLKNGTTTVATYTYNQGQLSSVTYAAYNNEVVSYTYDSNGVLLSTKLSDSSNNTISTTYYNSQGQVTNVYNGGDNTTGALFATYTYDAQGRISNIAYATGNNLSYSYTNDGAAGTSTLADSSSNKIQVSTLDVLGRVTKIVYYTNNSPNGFEYDRSYNADGTSQATLFKNGTVIHTYTYDAQGNQTGST